MSAEDERIWSVLSHLSMFLNLFTGLLGAVAALVVWPVFKDRSRKVTFHALQSMWYQIGWLVILAVALLLAVAVLLGTTGGRFGYATVPGRDHTDTLEG